MTHNTEILIPGASTKAEFIASVFDLGSEFASDADKLPSRSHRRAFRKSLRIAVRDHFQTKPWSVYAGNSETQEALAMGLIDAAKQRAFTNVGSRSHGNRTHWRKSIATLHARLSR